MSKRSPAARIMAYCKTAPIDELRVVLEMARELYKQRVEDGPGEVYVPQPTTPRRARKPRKARGTAAPSLPLENEAAAS